MSKQRVVIDLDKELWRQVSIRVAELQTTKKEFVESTLREMLKEGKK